MRAPPKNQKGTRGSLSATSTKLNTAFGAGFPWKKQFCSSAGGCAVHATQPTPTNWAWRARVPTCRLSVLMPSLILMCWGPMSSRRRFCWFSSACAFCSSRFSLAISFFLLCEDRDTYTLLDQTAFVWLHAATPRDPRRCTCIISAVLDQHVLV